MKYPNTSPKTELTLSAAHDVDRCVACSPDDFPPYERVPPAPVRVLVGSPLSKNESIFIGHTIAWIAFGLLAVNICVQVFR